eukprot:442268-Prorocentrum_minimum.AAC.1
MAFREHALDDCRLVPGGFSQKDLPVHNVSGLWASSARDQAPGSIALPAPWLFGVTISALGLSIILS